MSGQIRNSLLIYILVQYIPSTTALGHWTHGQFIKKNTGKITTKIFIVLPRHTIYSKKKVIYYSSTKSILLENIKNKNIILFSQTINPKFQTARNEIIVIKWLISIRPNLLCWRLNADKVKLVY